MIVSEISSIVKTKINVDKKENVVFVVKNKILKPND